MYIPVQELNSEVPSELAHIVDVLMEKDPNNRPESWAEVVSLFKKLHLNHKHFSLGDHHNGHGVDDSSKERKGINPIIPASIVGGMALVAVVLFFMFKGESKPKVKPMSQYEIAFKEWKRLAPTLKGVPTKQAFSRVQAFLKKYKENSPKVAQGMSRELESRLIKEKREKEQLELAKKAYRKEGEWLLEKGVKEKIKKKSLKELEALDKWFTKFFSKEQENEDFAYVFSKDEKRKISSVYLFAGTVLNQEKARLLREKEEAERKKREAAKAKRLAAEKLKEQKRQAILEQNQVIDEFYVMLDSFLGLPSKERTTRELIDRLDDWNSRYQMKPGEYVARYDFLKENMSDTLTIKTILIDSKILIGYIFPKKINRDEYEVVEVKNEYIWLQKKDRGVLLKKKLKWSKVRRYYSSLILELLLKHPKRMNDEAIRSILVYFLLKKQYDRFDKFASTLKRRIKNYQFWLDIESVFKNSSTEAHAVRVWQAYNKLKEEKKNVLRALSELENHCSQTDLYRRYLPIITEDLERYKKYSPELYVSRLLKKIDGLQKGLSEREIMEMNNVLVQRFGYLNYISSRLKYQLIKRKQFSLREMGDKSQVKSIRDSRIPFFFWAFENPVDSWKYGEIIKGKNMRARFLKEFALQTTSLPIGNFYEAKHLFSITQREFGSLRSLRGPGQAWVAALLFSTGYLADYYGNSDLSNIIEGILGRVAERKRHLTIPIAIEYLLLRRSYMPLHIIRPRRIINSKQQTYGYRAALLHMLACLQQSNVKEYGRLLNKYAALGVKDRKLQKDFEFAGLIQLIALGQHFNEKKLRSVYKDTFFKQTLARMFLDGVTFAILNHKYKLSGKELIAYEKLFKNAMGQGGILGHTVQYRLMLLKFSLTKNNGELLKAVKKELNDYSLAALPSYRNLMLLKLGLELQRSPKEQKLLLSSYNAFTRGSPLFGAEDWRALQETVRERSSKPVSSLMQRGASKKSYWFGVLTLMLNSRNNPLKRELLKFFLQDNGNRVRLLPEEILFLKRMAR